MAMFIHVHVQIQMNYLTEGIKKLRAVYVIKAKDEATKTVRLWRGMRNLDVGDKFMANRAGGTEVRDAPNVGESSAPHAPSLHPQVAPMSTTKDMGVAVHYGLSESREQAGLCWASMLRDVGGSCDSITNDDENKPNQHIENVGGAR